MRIAILSDVHANLPALEATLADVGAQDPDVVLCLGDLVGYAPWPNEVVAAVRGRRIPTIAGNYDEGVGLASDDCGCAYRSPEERERGRQSIAYTNAVVTPATRAFLHSLPRHLILELGPREPRLRVMLVHGSPRRVNEYLFEDRPDRSFRRLLDDARADVLVCGHTHRPFWKRLQEPGDPGPRHGLRLCSLQEPRQPLRCGDGRAR